VEWSGVEWSGVEWKGEERRRRKTNVRGDSWASLVETLEFLISTNYMLTSFGFTFIHVRYIS
jgi:hypothetical protein